jgi:2,4-dienoyl-CoA reductase (NADPH2)
MHLNLERVDPDGARLAAFYAERARGGAGLIVTGGAAVSRVGEGGPEYSIVGEAGDSERWRRVVDAVHREGGRIALQLFHAGRYALESSFGLTPVAPSAVYSRFSRCEPHALTSDEVEATVREFADAAREAAVVGFDAVEVMGSEGYLINQFASPVTNLRDDEWGGDAERRRAFPVAVVTAVRAAAAGLPVIMRISGADLVEGSSTPQEIDDLAVAVAAAGADAIDVGVGWHESRVPTVQSLVPHGVWVDTAARIKAALTGAGIPVPVIASNRINSVAEADRILGEGSVDLVSMARPFLADPRILATSFGGSPELVNTCIGCNEACIDRSLGSEPVSCLVNPRAGRELEFPSGSQLVPLTVLVVGGGPAGMEAARALAVRGASVTLREAGPRIGGQFLLAGMVPGKADFLETVRYFEHELPRLGVTVECDTPVEGLDDLAGFDHVVVATGVRPREVELGRAPAADEPGTAAVEIAGPHAAPVPRVVGYREAFEDLGSLGERVAVVGGGGIAVDLAHLLAATAPGEARAVGEPGDRGSEAEIREQFLVDNALAPGDRSRARRAVTVMRRSGSVGAGMGLTTRWAVVQSIRSVGVETLTGVVYEGLAPGGILIEHEGVRRLVEADVVVLAAGGEARRTLADRLQDGGIPHTVIGGAEAPHANAVLAFEQGLRAATAIADGASAAAQAGAAPRSKL